MSPSKKKRRVEEAESIEGTIRFTVKSVSKMATEFDRISPNQIIGGFPWLVSAKKKGSGDGASFGLYLHCNKSSESRVWFCKCSFTVSLLNQNDPAKSIFKNLIWRFRSADLTGYGNPRIIEWNELLDEKKGFIVDDSIVVEAKVNVKDTRSGKSFRSKPEHNFYSPSPNSNVVLVVEKTSFHVSKQLLATQSNYFDILFHEKFKEKDAEKITLDGVSAKDFLLLLRALYRLGDELTENNIEGPLKLSSMWQITRVLDEVEKHLLVSDSPQLERKLQWAGNYGLHTLFDSCISKLTTCQQIADLMETDPYVECSSETKETLFHLYVKLDPNTNNAPKRRTRIGEQEGFEGTIRFHVKDVSKMTTGSGASSDAVNVGGFSWYIITNKQGNGKRSKLGVNLHCAKTSESLVWFCNCSYTVSLIHHEDDAKALNESLTLRFHSNDLSVDGQRIASINFLASEKKFVKDDSIIIEVKMKVDRPSGTSFRPKPDHDFISASPKSDVILAVEDKKFHVSKQLLAVWSPHFDKLFNQVKEVQDKAAEIVPLKEKEADAEVKEKSEEKKSAKEVGKEKEVKEKVVEKFTLEDVEAEEFENLLRVLYRLGDSFTEAKIEGILKLSDEWKITRVLDEVEKHLLSSDLPSLDLKLQWAGNYGLHTLHDVCLSKLTTCQQIVDLKETEQYKDYSAETKEALFELYVKLDPNTKKKEKTD